MEVFGVLAAVLGIFLIGQGSQPEQAQQEKEAIVEAQPAQYQYPSVKNAPQTGPKIEYGPNVLSWSEEQGYYITDYGRYRAWREASATETEVQSGKAASSDAGKLKRLQHSGTGDRSSARELPYGSHPLPGESVSAEMETGRTEYEQALRASKMTAGALDATLAGEPYIVKLVDAGALPPAVCQEGARSVYAADLKTPRSDKSSLSVFEVAVECL